jgi:cellulose synthase/poly-beta-1,6-N-acetylglucosamine synthase-like glycosyltransferase
MTATRTSVLLCAYDPDPGMLLEAVESALSQTVPDLEIVLVDDGSEPPLAPLLCAVEDPRLRPIRSERNRGVSAARNLALAHARAPLVSHLDADDMWEPNYLEQVLPRFRDPCVGVVYTNASIIGHPEGLDTYIRDISVHPMDRFPKIAEQNPIPSLTATMRADAVRAVGGYARWLSRASDYHLWCKLVAAGWRFEYVDRKLAHYRWPEPGRGISYDRRTMELAELKLWLGFCLRHPRIPGPRRQLRTRIKRELHRLL